MEAERVAGVDGGLAAKADAGGEEVAEAVWVLEGGGGGRIDGRLGAFGSVIARSRREDGRLQQ